MQEWLKSTGGQGNAFVIDHPKYTFAAVVVGLFLFVTLPNASDFNSSATSPLVTALVIALSVAKNRPRDASGRIAANHGMCAATPKARNAQKPNTLATTAFGIQAVGCSGASQASESGTSKNTARLLHPKTIWRW